MTFNLVPILLYYETLTMPGELYFPHQHQLPSPIEGRDIGVREWYEHVYSSFEPLSLAREIELGTQIQQGISSANELLIDGIGHGILQSRRRELRRLVSGGKNAQIELCYHNLSLVPRVVDRIIKPGPEDEPPVLTDDDWLDLIQEGNEGLVEAAQRFNPRGRKSFGYYASQIIHQKVTSAMRAETEFFEIPVEDLKDTVAQRPDSDDSANFEDVVDTRDLLSRLLAQLSELERLVLESSTGLGGRQPMSRKEIAQLLTVRKLVRESPYLPVSVGEVDTIKGGALNTLRNSLELTR